LAAAVNDPRPGCSFWPDGGQNHAEDDLAMDVDVPADDAPAAAAENFQVR